MPAVMMSLFVLFSGSGITAVADQPAATPAAPFRLVTADLQKELDRASAEGYAVALGWPAYDAVILRRRTDAESRTTYRVLNGKKAIEQGLAQGYRAVPDTLDVSDGALLVIATPSAEGERYESLLLQTNRTATFEREIRDARTRGFRVIGMASDGSGHAALLERAVGEPPETAGGGGVVLIAANRQDTIQKELADRAAAGYRLTAVSCWKEMVVALEQRRGESRVEYRVLSTTKSSTLEREMNAAASNGFRLPSGTLHAIQKGSVLGLSPAGFEYVAVMEKGSAGEPAPEYVIIGAKRTSTLAREFDESVAKGLIPVALSLGYSSQETIVVFERRRP